MTKSDTEIMEIIEAFDLTRCTYSAAELECPEVACEYGRAVAEPRRGEDAGIGDPGQAASVVDRRRRAVGSTTFTTSSLIRLLSVTGGPFGLVSV